MRLYIIIIIEQIKIALHRRSGMEYAVKIMDKSYLTRVFNNIIDQQNKTKYAIVEKEVLSHSNHPLIIRLYYSFQDKDCLYLVLDLCRRGDLNSVICNNKLPLSIPIIRFYTAEIILALEYLHNELDVVHRDLKPDNILIGTDGHIRISDFGTALINQKAVSYREKSIDFCGTPLYVSPEVLRNEPLGPASDLWGLGCIIYQLYYGKTLFEPNKKYLYLYKQ